MRTFLTLAVASLASLALSACESDDTYDLPRYTPSPAPADTGRQQQVANAPVAQKSAPPPGSFDPGPSAPLPTKPVVCPGGGPLVDLVVADGGARDLMTFDPAALTFEKIGHLACDDQSEVRSMAVDRSGTAWVLYESGRLFQVSTTDASCSAPIVLARNGLDFATFDMAFVGRPDDPSREDLFIANVVTSTDLGRIDTSATPMQISRVGKLKPPILGGAFALAGSGSGALVGAFTSIEHAQVALFDKESAATVDAVELFPISRALGEAKLHAAPRTAAAIYDGAMWIFGEGLDAASVGAAGAAVARYDLADGGLKIVRKQTGIHPLAAGAAGCVPVH